MADTEPQSSVVEILVEQTCRISASKERYDCQIDIFVG